MACIGPLVALTEEQQRLNEQAIQNTIDEWKNKLEEGDKIKRVWLIRMKVSRYDITVG